MVTYLKSFAVFKHFDSLTNSDFRELAINIGNRKFEEEGDYVYRMGDTAEYIYFIMKGQVSQRLRNPRIKNFRWF